MQDIALPPLRERHRAATWAALREAAANLALEHGLTGATIDAISARAGVSPRTFFNYFSSKEEAVLGIQSPVMPGGAITAFDARDTDLFTRTVRLFAAVSSTTVRDHSDLAIRRDLVQRFPELRVHLTRHVAQAEHLVEELLEDRVATGRISLAGAPEALPASLRALVVLAGTTIRFAFERGGSLGGIPSDTDLDAAIALFRTVMEEAK